MSTSGTSIEDAGSGDDVASRAFRFTMTFFVILLVTTAALQVTTLFGGRSNGTLSDVWPQSWTFFRTASTASSTVAYRINDLGALELMTQREATGGELWGLRRGNYVQRWEIALLSASVPESRWHECAAGDLGCAEAITAADPVLAVNNAGAPSLCGHLALMRVRPGASELDDPGGLRARLIRGATLDVRCERR